MDKVIHLTARLGCDPHRAFEHFTVDEQLETWLTAAAEVEPAVGGRYELFWEPEHRERNSTLGCRITALEPDTLLAFEWRSPQQFSHFANDAAPLTHVVVLFAPRAAGTEVHLIHSGWRSTPEWEEARQWQEQAWTVALARLEQQAQDKIEGAAE
jgi:uncharacterized protein YndB with AHSA1/START domain